MKSKRLFPLIVVCVLCCGTCYSGVAFQGVGWGIFGVPDPNTGKDYSGVGTKVFKNGTLAKGEKETIFTLNDTVFSTGIGEVFPLLSLEYHNGRTVLDTTVDSVPVTLKVTFTSPSWSTINLLEFRFENIVTNNDLPENADQLVFHDLPASTAFDLDGGLYNIEILGFSNDGGATFISSIILEEEGDAEADLYARITVPEPSVLAILLAGTLYFRTRRRNIKINN
ncbi:MAG: choice-of-anchor K domain-containing protein [Planctomycetota bacterium]